MSCRSLAYARSLLRFGSSCGAVPSSSCRAICSRLLGCPFFLIKAFQRIRCPVAFSVAMSWRLRSPSSRSSSRRAASPASLVDVIIALPSHLLRPALRPASRLASRPVPLWVMSSSPPCLIAPSCRSACGHRSPRPACRNSGERDGTGRLSRHRLPALPPLLALGWRLACVRFLVAVCLLTCRRLCRYCGVEIVYMICPVVII